MPLPELKKGEDLRDYKQLSQVERDLLGFAVNQGAATPHHVATMFSSNGEATRMLKSRLLSFVGKITHWKITQQEYHEIPNQTACWYVDPPYQNMGKRYMTNNVVFDELGKWCRKLVGQVIVCEAGEANWLPFVMLRQTNKTRKAGGDIRRQVTKELIWYRSDKKTGFGLV